MNLAFATEDVIHCDMRKATAAELRVLAATISRAANCKAIAEDKGYRRYLANRASALHIGDKIHVIIHGHQYETQVKGFDTNAHGLPFVKFRIDWDEGPIDYNWSVALVEKAHDTPEAGVLQPATDNPCDGCQHGNCHICMNGGP